MTTPTLAIELKALSFSYPDGSKALQNISLAIRQDERVGLVGPNGAGKSTLLLHLNGILESPGVTILGLPVIKSNLRTIRQAVGLVFQDPDDQLFCPTVFEDIAFGPRNLRVPAEETGRRVRESLCAVGLSGVEERGAFHLSLGQKKRAALATVLAMRPKVLVLDEPASHLDPRGRRELIALLKTIPGTMLVASHDFELVAALCGRVVVLSEGALAGDGTPEVILRDKEFLLAHGLA